MIDNDLIIWREKIPDVEKGVFGYVSENINGKVICLYLQQPDKERTKAGWIAESYAKVIVEQIPSDVLPYEFVLKVITKYPNAIHIFFGGLRHTLKIYLDYYIDKEKDSKLIIIAEKPVLKKSSIIKLTKYLLYKSLSLRYNSNIHAFLAMGEKGVSRYINYGFKQKIIFPFMYNPLIIQNDIIQSEKEIKVNNPLRFLYLGRFDFKIKGCHNLISAFNNINSELKDYWTLTFIGGYGDNKDEILKWIDTKDNVYYDGSWEQSDIINKMSKYDICLVPSIEDGWNLSPNYSIYSNIGAIVSNEAISHELIKNSDSGIIYNYNDVDKLIESIEYAINNPNIVLKWKYNAVKYKNRISSETVGKYLIDIINYTFFNSEIKPKCPWIN